MLPTLRQLRYFSALAETRHFGRAGERCNVTQPAMSMQIQQLEETLGVPLVERLSSGVLLTAAGREVAERCRAILLAVQDLSELARHRDRLLAGPLRLGVIPTVAPYVLPRILPRLGAAYLELALSLRESQTEHLVDQLVRGELDLLLLALPIDRPDVVTEALFGDVFWFAVPARHPMAGRTSIRQEDLASEPVLLLEEGHCLRDQALALCQAAGGSAASDFRASSLQTVVQMVANGHGSTILPELALAVEVGDRTGIRVVPFTAPAPARSIGLAWRRSSPRSDDFREFGRLVLEVCRPTGPRPS